MLCNTAVTQYMAQMSVTASAKYGRYTHTALNLCMLSEVWEQKPADNMRDHETVCTPCR